MPHSFFQSIFGQKKSSRQGVARSSVKKPVKNPDAAEATTRKSPDRDLTVIFPANRWCPESRITTALTPMGSNLYRLDEGDWCGPISFGDVIEALPTGVEGILRFRSRVKRAGLRRNGYIIPHDLVDKPRFADLMEEIEHLGGFAAVDCKGLFLVYLPRTCDLDVTQELNRICRNR